MYAHVENNKITRQVQTLPTAWRNVSGLHLGTQSELKELGWLPIELTEVTPSGSKVRGEDKITIESAKVIIVQQLREKTAEEINKNWERLRRERNRLLSESDWTQGSDCPLSDAKKEEWKTYRKTLRDIPTTVDIHNVVWPSVPA